MIDKKTAIFNAGRDLFLLKGYKDVNVSDITKLAEMSVGTFYNYYTSKEELFAEIYHKENETAKQAIIGNINIEDEPITIVSSFITKIMNTLNSNLILKEWYNKDVSGNLEKTYRNKESKKDSFVYVFFKSLLEKWRSQGKIRDDIDDSQIFGLYNVLLFLDTHKDEVGADPYVMQLLIEFIMKGITLPHKE